MSAISIAVVFLVGPTMFQEHYHHRKQADGGAA
jgi:hypothetical protein